jgi:hypothetical protein
MRPFNDHQGERARGGRGAPLAPRAPADHRLAANPWWRLMAERARKWPSGGLRQRRRTPPSLLPWTSKSGRLAGLVECWYARFAQATSADARRVLLVRSASARGGDDDACLQAAGGALAGILRPAFSSAPSFLPGRGTRRHPHAPSGRRRRSRAHHPLDERRDLRDRQHVQSLRWSACPSEREGTLWSVPGTAPVSTSAPATWSEARRCSPSPASRRAPEAGRSSFAGQAKPDRPGPPSLKG